jgi:predicted nucleic acid-binding protein
MIVADSDVLIDALRGREPAKGRIAQEIEKGALATTSVSVFELLSGARTASARKK